jgi:hypothetical protein
MHRLRIAFEGSFARKLGGVGLAALGGVFAVACSSSSSGTPLSAFVGSWLCTDTRAAGIGEDAGTSVPTASTMGVTIASVTNDHFAAVVQADAGAACSLQFTATGNSGTLGAGQSCSAADGTAFAYTSGDATVSGNQLLVNLAFTTTSAGGAGSGTDSIGCQRDIPSGGPVTGGGGW